ncbi:hypothetical protein KBB27_03105 [Patescibacteria group bacterium]|nr:hypothetical protein [Patescibacteria group bacterium]
MSHEFSKQEVISLEKRRYFDGINHENWRERYPDHCVLLHGGRVLTFSNRLEDLADVLYDYTMQGIDVEKIAILFIDTTESIVEQEKRLAIEEIKWRHAPHSVTDDYIKRREHGVFRPRNEVEFTKYRITSMRYDMSVDLEMDRNTKKNAPLLGEVYAEETHERVTSALNERYTSEEWDAIIYQAIKTRDAKFLQDLNDPLLKTNKEHLLIAAKVVQDMRRVFANLTFSPSLDEEST